MGNNYYKNFVAKTLTDEVLEATTEAVKTQVKRAKIKDDFLAAYYALYIMKELSFKALLKQYMSICMCNKKYQKKEALKLIQAIRNALTGAKFKEPETNYTDFNLGNLPSYLELIPMSYKAVVEQLLRNIDFVNSHDCGSQYAPSQLHSNDEFIDSYATDYANYSTNRIINFFENSISSMRDVYTKATTPSGALDVIIANWDFIYSHEKVYEVVECIIQLSNEIRETKEIEKKVIEGIRAISE